MRSPNTLQYFDHGPIKAHGNLTDVSLRLDLDARATRTSLSARDVNPAAIFNLRLYDGRLEALLDEVAHAGAAPVAASVKREIVRQHLQLQVFEAVPA